MSASTLPRIAPLAAVALGGLYLMELVATAEVSTRGAGYYGLLEGFLVTPSASYAEGALDRPEAFFEISGLEVQAESGAHPTLEVDLVITTPFGDPTSPTLVVPAEYVLDNPDNSEVWAAEFPALPEGEYSFLFRFRLTPEDSYSYADLDGSLNGYSEEGFGFLTVGPAPTPSPSPSPSPSPTPTRTPIPTAPPTPTPSFTPFPSPTPTPIPLPLAPEVIAEYIVGIRPLKVDFPGPVLPPEIDVNLDGFVDSGDVALSAKLRASAPTAAP